MAGGDKLSVMIIGHSLIDDVKYFAHHSMKGASNLRLEQLEVDWQTMRGLNWRKLRKHIVPKIGLGNKQSLPDIIYIHVAENDLDSKESYSIVARKYLHQVRTWIDSLGVKVVILGNGIPRRKTRKSDFDRKWRLFNAQMRSRLLHSDSKAHGKVTADRFIEPGLWWWEHERLSKTSPKQDPQLAKRKFAFDGVHLNYRSTKRLYYSIRTALLEASRNISSK